MKAILGFILVLSSFAFANDVSKLGHSYGFMLLDNGKTYTIKSYYDSEGVQMPQPLGFFTLPEEVEKSGSNYYIDKNDVIHTTDSDGYIYKDMHYLDRHSPVDAGGVFFITRKSGSESNAAHIVMVDGTIKEHHAEGFDLFDRASRFGGVYFVDPWGYIYIANPYDGKFYKAKKEFRAKKRWVKHYGHNYLLMNNGDLIVIGFAPRKYKDENGEIKTKHIVTMKRKKKEFKNTIKHGGTFFFNNNNEMITINDRGVVKNSGQVAIESLNIEKSQEIPEQLGTNYFIYDTGEAFMLDKDGVLWFLKKLPFYERVGIVNVPFER